VIWDNEKDDSRQIRSVKHVYFVFHQNRLMILSIKLSSDDIVY